MRPALALPPALLDALREYRRVRRIKARQIAEGRVLLAEMFSGKRPLRPGYLEKPLLRAAYICYYLPIHFLKVQLVLAELESFAGPVEGPALDYGCGPGTATLALGHGTVDLFDVVDEAVDDAEFLIKTAALAMSVRRVDEHSFAGPYRLILASHVLAELSDPAPLRRLIEDHLHPEGHLVVIEPALRDHTRRLMQWRDELAAAGFRIAAPCLGIDRCPMRATDELWCHQDVPWSRPPLIDDIDRRTGLRTESLKYSYLVVTRTGATLAANPKAQWRLVTDLHREKGRSWGMLCGRTGPLCKTDMLSRHRSPDRNAFERARRGDVFEITPPIAGPSARIGESTVVTRP